MDYKIDEVKVAGNSCINCGQQTNVKRIDGHYIAHEIEHVLHFERGILYTIRELITSPGENVRRYISDDRNRLVKPIIFIIITSLIYSIAAHFFHIDDGYVNYHGAESTSISKMFKWIQDHYGYGNILMGVFIAFWTKLFFKKSGYNFFEILILLCFAMGIGMLLYAVIVIIQGISHIQLTQVGGMLGVLYCAWAVGQFFNKRKFASYLRALSAYILGMITFALTIVSIGLVIDLVFKH
ncbi:MAG: DUF3667 domain-containing protein [Pedobacter sp.]|nr:MAG: DUF3667 domain-containing protein [Pedobacter sp.]